MRLGEAMEELGVGFFEMPIPPEDVEGYAELAQRLTIPIALDSIMTRHETVELIRNRAIDIVQPDVCRAGGITECRRIAELADNFGLAFQPHVSIGSAVHVAASAHLAVAMPNSIVCEYWIGKNPIGAAIAATPAEVKNGYLFAPTGAGLGIGLDEQALLRHGSRNERMRMKRTRELLRSHCCSSDLRAAPRAAIVDAGVSAERVRSNGAITIERSGKRAVYQPIFVVIRAESDPQLGLSGFASTPGESLEGVNVENYPLPRWRAASGNGTTDVVYQAGSVTEVRAIRFAHSA